MDYLNIVMHSDPILDVLNKLNCLQRMIIVQLAHESYVLWSIGWVF